MDRGKAGLFSAAMALAMGTAAPATAGTSIATATVAMMVANECSIAGSTVSLGTFLTTQTFQDIANENGYFDADDNWFEGTRGTQSLNLGSVTCDSAVPYTATIQGSGPDGGIVMNIGGKKMTASIWIKSIGEQVLADDVVPNLGAYASDLTWPRPSGAGTGTKQVIKGTIPLGFGFVKQQNGGTADITDPLGTAGTYSDILLYTLNF